MGFVARALLVVDDNRTIRACVRIYLTGLDITVLEAASGDQALDILKSAVVDAIIADLKMPGMDGISFIRRIRQDARPAVQALPILLLTGDKSAESAEQGRVAGATGLITKPVTSQELRAAVLRVLERPAGGPPR